MQTNTIHTLARYQVLMKAGRLSSPIDVLLDDLVRYQSAGIQAPFADQPRAVPTVARSAGVKGVRGRTSGHAKST
jgi:hypothetical protein